ncbi:hypothetical protein [Clostridium thailandense]|uniref:hypothetical protein n=1 Tax=Clostridium thailandense TaxID=2794346 RepID=UPI00398946E8
MKIDNISQLIRYNAVQNLSNMNEGLSSNSSEILFSSILGDMMQDTEVNYLKNKSKNNGNPKAVSNFDSLSLQPQQMARMMSILAQHSILSTLNGNNAGSMYNGTYGISSMMGQNSYTALMLGYALGKMSQSSHSATKQTK